MTMFRGKKKFAARVDLCVAFFQFIMPALRLVNFEAYASTLKSHIETVLNREGLSHMNISIEKTSPTSFTIKVPEQDYRGKFRLKNGKFF